MANISLRKKGNDLDSFKVAITDTTLKKVTKTLDYGPRGATGPMPSPLTIIGGAIITLKAGFVATEASINLYDSDEELQETHKFSFSPNDSKLSLGNISIDRDVAIFEVECHTEPNNLTITKGDFETNKGKYSVNIGEDSTTVLGFNDETTTINKPSNVDLGSVEVTFAKGAIFESGYVEVYDKNKTLLNTFNLIYDKGTSTASYTLHYEIKTSLMLVYVKFHELPSVDKVPTFNHTYSMLPSELEQLLIEGLGVTTASGVIDLRDFMLNLLSFPFEVPTDFTGEKKPIVLGAYTRKTTATTLKGDIIRYNLGSIEVPLKYKNGYDFYATETTLILPYTENVTLPPEYVIGATISVEYLVEVYRGTVNINVTSSKTDKPIYNGTTSIGRQIPFISYWTVLADESIYTSVYNNQNKATIEVKRKPPLQLENGLDTNEYGTIGKYKGYIEVSEVTLSGSTMGSYEQEQLISILNNGVIL